MAGAPPPPAADPLYAVTPEEFVAERDTLARRLKADGDKALAATVARLRRPTPSAWALNQVARHDGALVVAALAAGAELRAASEAAASGDASGLRAATAADREATNRVVAAAAEVLGTRGPGLRQELAATVRAAVLDDAVAEALEAGVLASHHAAPGFGFGFETAADDGAELAPPRAATSPKAAPVPAPGPAKPAAKGKGGDATADKVACAAALAETKAAVAAKEAAAVEEAERRSRRKEMAELRRTIKRLDATAARLSGRADEAEAVAAEARLAADAAEAELAAAQDRLAELEG